MFTKKDACIAWMPGPVLASGLCFLFLLVVLTAFKSARQDSLTLFLVGDSTMADKPGTPEENPERGWGQVLGRYFDPQVVIRNHARNGRSSKSFIGEGLWQEVVDQIKPGDYVFIQFGHNDQKTHDPDRYTNPWTGYRRNLERFVDEALARGGHPVLLSSIVRRHFNDAGTLTDTHGPYPFVTRLVAGAKGVPFIDMQWLTEDLVNQQGVERSKEIYLWVDPGQYADLPDGKEDNTHLSLKGAVAFAGLVAGEIRRLDLPLAAYLREPGQ